MMAPRLPSVNGVLCQLSILSGEFVVSSLEDHELVLRVCLLIA
jgi:hypothetical protein